MRKRIAAAVCLCLALLALSGCVNRIDDALPEDPVAFHTHTFINPADENDTYLAIEYEGRVYIPYGNLSGMIDGNDIGRCLGYYVQDGSKMEAVRILQLTNDPDVNFLMRMDIAGVMSQPDFFRAVDTKGEQIDIPPFIHAMDDPFWN